MKPVAKSGVERLFRQGGKHIELRPVRVTLPMYNGSKRLRLILQMKTGRRPGAWFDICGFRTLGRACMKCRLRCASNPILASRGNDRESHQREVHVGNAPLISLS